jgi:hypothetical protein
MIKSLAGSKPGIRHQWTANLPCREASRDRHIPVFGPQQWEPSFVRRDYDPRWAAVSNP